MFHAKLDKKQKILFYTPVSKFLKILTLNICDGAKQIYPKKKKKILRKDTLRISVAAVRRCTVKKVSLKNSPPVYWHITKIHDIHHVQNSHKTCSKIQKAWFLLLQWVAQSRKMSRKMFILIYLSNN